MKNGLTGHGHGRRAAHDGTQAAVGHALVAPSC